MGKALTAFWQGETRADGTMTPATRALAFVS